MCAELNLKKKLECFSVPMETWGSDDAVSFTGPSVKIPVFEIRSRSSERNAYLLKISTVSFPSYQHRLQSNEKKITQHY